MSRRGAPQLGLFGGEAPPLPPPPPPDPAWSALAARLPAGLAFGTSSWTFPGWGGLVYRRRYPDRATFVAESLAEYAAFPLFRTVGIDRGYYAPVDADTLTRYAEALPPGFRAVSKVWSEITTLRFPDHPSHGARAGCDNPSFLDPERFAERVAAPYADAFAAHAGPFVLELPRVHGPVDPRAFAERLDAFLRDAPGGFRYAVELRDRRLFTPRYARTLERHGASHVASYWSAMPGPGAQWDRTRGLAAAAGHVVLRLMLPPGARYAELKAAYHPFDRLVAPDEGMRGEVVRVVEEALGDGVDTWVVVNNKAEGSAPLTIAALARALAGGDLTERDGSGCPGAAGG